MVGQARRCLNLAQQSKKLQGCARVTRRKYQCPLQRNTTGGDAGAAKAERVWIWVGNQCCAAVHAWVTELREQKQQQRTL